VEREEGGEGGRERDERRKMSERRKSTSNILNVHFLLQLDMCLHSKHIYFYVSIVNISNFLPMLPVHWCWHPSYIHFFEGILDILIKNLVIFAFAILFLLLKINKMYIYKRTQVPIGSCNITLVHK
jgi:hypothetical protein